MKSSKRSREQLKRTAGRGFEPLELRVLLAATPRGGVPYIDLGPSDNLGWDQPRVTVELFADPSGNNSVGPTAFSSFLLDTGANTITAFASAVNEMEGLPFSYTTAGKFEESGIAGASVFDISVPYRFEFSGTDGIGHTLPDTRIISDPDNDVSFLGPWGVVGMPAMAGQVTTLDYTVWETFDGVNLNQRVEFGNELPADPGHRYSIPVDNRVRFTPEGHVIEGDAPPIWADIPFLDVYLVHEGQTAHGDFVFDTGAQLSIMNTQTAIDAGLDSNNDGVINSLDANFTGTVDVGGLGGTLTVPTVAFSEVHVPTAEGVDLVWTDLDWIVLDIADGIDGVVGSDILLSGWLGALLVPGQSGWVDKAQLDFREMATTGRGTVYLDVNPSRDIVIEPPENDFVVTSLLPTRTGFVAEFNEALNADTLNLFDTETGGLGPADVTLVGAQSGLVTGSVVVDSALQSVTFIKTDGLLQPDTYTVTLRGADDGFRSRSNRVLDGDDDSVAGGDFSQSFVVESSGADRPVVSISNFVRGPGQDVNLPADASLGIPVSISEGTGVRNAEVRIDYDPALLNITAATIGPGLSAGAAATIDLSTAGTAVLTVTSPADLPAGSQILAHLQASVPTANASANYGRQQVLDVHSVFLTDANANPIPAIADEAVHLVSYFGDVSGNGRVNASDAAQVARFAALTDGGFAASLSTDPIVVGDISGNGRINAADASRVAQFAALIEVPEIPPIPSGVAVAGVADLGPGLPDLRFPAVQVASATIQATGVQSSDAPLLPPVGPDPYQAVDTVMASMDMLDEDADQMLIPSLEDAIAELLSAELPAG